MPQSENLLRRQMHTVAILQLCLDRDVKISRHHIIICTVKISEIHSIMTLGLHGGGIIREIILECISIFNHKHSIGK